MRLSHKTLIGFMLIGWLGCSGPDETLEIQSGETPPQAAVLPTSASSSSPAGSGTPLYDPSANRRDLLDKALALANTSHRRVLIQWGHNQCVWCYRLHDLFETDPEIHQFLNSNYVFVPLDSTNPEFPPTLGIQLWSVPTLTILNEHGQPLINQETGSLESTTQYDHPKVLDFLKQWSPSPGNPPNMKENTPPTQP